MKKTCSMNMVSVASLIVAQIQMSSGCIVSTENGGLKFWVQKMAKIFLKGLSKKLRNLMNCDSGGRAKMQLYSIQDLAVTSDASEDGEESQLPK